MSFMDRVRTSGATPPPPTAEDAIEQGDFVREDGSMQVAGTHENDSQEITVMHAETELIPNAGGDDPRAETQRVMNADGYTAGIGVTSMSELVDDRSLSTRVRDWARSSDNRSVSDTDEDIVRRRLLTTGGVALVVGSALVLGSCLGGDDAPDSKLFEQQLEIESSVDPFEFSVSRSIYPAEFFVGYGLGDRALPALQLSLLPDRQSGSYERATNTFFVGMTIVDQFSQAELEQLQTGQISLSNEQLQQLASLNDMQTALEYLQSSPACLSTLQEMVETLQITSPEAYIDFVDAPVRYLFYIQDGQQWQPIDIQELCANES